MLSGRISNVAELNPRRWKGQCLPFAPEPEMGPVTQNPFHAWVVQLLAHCR